jgi:hypothetical protein
MVADVEVGHGFLAHWNEVRKLELGWSGKVVEQEPKGKLIDFKKVGLRPSREPELELLRFF